ncbi:hypothetical protein [Ornithinimicrobium panacihumi]|uniref:hypothetical protein n=1 Tax=Ornithinimicrobium panacihumi TaxID=2008449 RepID=UPI003F89FA59
MFFKTDADRAAAQGGKARHDAATAGSNAADGARNLGAAVVAAIAEATAPQDDRKTRRHAHKTRAKALKAAGKDRTAAEKAAAKAAKHGRKAADHSKVALGKKSEAAGGTVAALAGVAGAKAGKTAHHAAEVAREQGSHAAEVLREQGSHAAHVVKDKAGPLGEAAAEKAGIGAAIVAALAAAAREKAAETRDRAVVGMDHGIDAAVPRAQEGVAAVAPKVDHLRDLINEELLPKIQAMLGDVQTGKDRVLAKDEGVVASLTGGPKTTGRKKKGGTMITLGLLAAAGAGVAWYLSRQQQAVATDPWASQAGSADPWASRAPVATEVAPVADVAVADVTTTDVTAAAPSAEVASGEAHMLTNEEMDELGSEQPPTMDEVNDGLDEVRQELEDEDDRPGRHRA